MSRTQFAISIALLVVSGTLAFVISFSDGDGKSAHQHQENNATSTSERSSVGVAPKSKAYHINEVSVGQRTDIDRTVYEVTVAREEDRESAIRIEEESRERLKKLTERYKLTKNQRREVYPVIAGFHPLFRAGMLVNGQTVPHEQYRAEAATSSTAFEDTLYPLLDIYQQENLRQDILGKVSLRDSINGQFVDDTNLAFDIGELVVEAAPENEEETTPKTPQRTEKETPKEEEAVIQETE